MTLIQIANMNERIKELEKLAWVYQTQIFKDQNGYRTIGEQEKVFDKEKFAELIVRECVGVADDYVKDCTCDEHKKCKHPQSAIGRKIKQHFGVTQSNIEAAESIHSDKGYSLGTPEAQEAFESKRGYKL